MQAQIAYTGRLIVLALILLVAILSLLTRIVYLGIVKHSFLLDQSTTRSVREISIPAHRGMITDRNGEPLAISIPVASVWVNPQLFHPTTAELNQLATLLGIMPTSLQQKVVAAAERSFLYLKRSVPLETATQITALHIPGIFYERSYKRYYPEGEAVAQVVGFTNIDDRGQEGLELAYDNWLYGTPGKIRVVKDRLGNVIANLGMVQQPQQGHDLVLSIDRRVQYLAYHALKNTVEKYQAESGSAVVLAVKTGEIIAMANMPTYNPNNRVDVKPAYYRNRAITDLFEPGSTMKAFSIANALDSGKYFPATLINTNPGRFVVNDNIIYDDEHVNNGVLSVTQVLQKSSDIGVAKMTLSLPADSLLNILRSVGFGQSTQSGFPGEASGVLPDHLRWRPFVLATLAFGYSISATAMQLAQAYAVIASGGLLRPVTFLKSAQIAPGKQVLSPKVCQQMLTMLEAVLDIGGTGTRAQIPGYHVAGKTGTAHIAGPHGYYSDRYFSLFAGIAPATDPQLVVFVVIKNPHGQYHGSKVAAPVFAAIMDGALRILNVPPDNMIVEES